MPLVALNPQAHFRMHSHNLVSHIMLYADPGIKEQRAAGSALNPDDGMGAHGQAWSTQVGRVPSEYGICICTMTWLSTFGFGPGF